MFVFCLTVFTKMERHFLILCEGCVEKEEFSAFQMFGIVLNISNAIIGLTLLAWGNSLGGKTVLHAHSKARS